MALIVSTTGSEYLAGLISDRLSATKMPIHRHTFGSGEKYRRFQSDDREALVSQQIVFVGSTDSDGDLQEVYDLGSAAAKFGSRKRVFAIPYSWYTTQERIVKPNDVVKAKTMARQLSGIPNVNSANDFLYMDLHVSGMQHYFEGDCTATELYAENALLRGIDSTITQCDIDPKLVMFGSADMGRPKWIKSYAKRYGTRYALVDKDRDFEKTEVAMVIGDVKGMVVFIYDDIIRSASTFINAANAYLERGALAVYGVCSHFALDDETVIDRLVNSRVTRFITTNTHRMSQHVRVLNNERFVLGDVSEIYAGAIQRRLM